MERDIPCRVTADLAAYDRKQREDAANAQRFDEYDDDLMRQIVGNDRLAKPVQELLTTLHQIEITSRSFGVDHAKIGEAIIPGLRALREACIDTFKDL